MAKIVIVGGGISGCGAALTAVKAGAEVTILERTDLLLGSALVAGNCDSAGRYTLSLEAKAMGAGEINEALKSIALPTSRSGKGWERRLREGRISPEMMARAKTGFTYDCGLVEPTIRRLLQEMGIQIHFESRAVDVEKEGGHLTRVKLDDGQWVEGDAFVDCTGTFGGMSNCIRYGGGRCVQCTFHRCPTFGDRVSIATKAGAPELMRKRPDGKPGLIPHGIHLNKASLSQDLRQRIEEEGAAFVPIKGLIDWQPDPVATYWLWGHAGFDPKTGGPLDPGASWATKPGPREYLNLSDRGAGYVGVPQFVGIPLEELRKLPGLENVLKLNPHGQRASPLVSLSLTPHEDSLRVTGFDNLFIAGEKAYVQGVIECLTNGLLAGHNAVRAVLGKDLLVLPRTTVAGDYIVYTAEKMQTEEGQMTVYGPHAGVYLSEIVKRGLYTTDADEVRQRIEQAGLSGIYAQKLT